MFHRGQGILFVLRLIIILPLQSVTSIPFDRKFSKALACRNDATTSSSSIVSPTQLVVIDPTRGGGGGPHDGDHGQDHDVGNAHNIHHIDAGDCKNRQDDHAVNKLILIIDVDNTLYNEQRLRQTSGFGIEEQIIQNTQRFCKEWMNITKERMEELYQKYGSTIEGLRHEYWSHNNNQSDKHNDDDDNNVKEWMERYYHQVYDPIDVSCLYDSSIRSNVAAITTTSTVNEEHHPSSSSTRIHNTTSTGYSHSSDDDDYASMATSIRNLLESLTASYKKKQNGVLDDDDDNYCPVIQLFLASNSPKFHVDKVLRALGLDQIPWDGVITPDTIPNQTLISYPTKHHPQQFYKTILQQQQQEEKDGMTTGGRTTKILILDDSVHNLQRAKEELGWEGQLIHHNDGCRRQQQQGLWEALHEALQVLSHHGQANHNSSSTTSFEFSDVKYLQSKNVVDQLSINRKVYRQVAMELAQRLLLLCSTDAMDSRCKDHLCIIDLGAGLLSMLESFLFTSINEEESGLFQLIERMTKRPLREIVYYAYESNKDLLEECRLSLIRMGFMPYKDHDSNFHVFRSVGHPHNMTVYLKGIDFRNDAEYHHEIKVTPHLIVGCCFADLFPPRVLVPSLLNFLSKISKPNFTPDTLLYFPITFRGTTQFFPPSAIEYSLCKQDCRSIPSDTIAYSFYNQALAEQGGQNLDPSLLIEEMHRYGVELIHSGSSDWSIDPVQHEYFWNAMMHFFQRLALHKLLQNGWNGIGWLRRAFTNRQKILVGNVDLLFRIPRQSRSSLDQTETNRLIDSHKGLESVIEEVRFVAPRNVTTVRMETPSQLMPNQVRVKSICSLISSGTELKIFRGSFDDDVLDVNIKGMSDQRMSYPLAYGYSLVGRVVECGSGVANANDLLGRLVFSFSPHATGAIVDVDSLHWVPDGISAADAMFMPAMETALSIVHDAHVRIGENVAIYGQGMIGLLVTSILSLQKLQGGGRFGTVTAFDTLTDRLAVSSMLGVSQALFSSGDAAVSQAGPFDVSIEVSGNPRALQSAIDHTVHGGRIILASWYGNDNVQLKLGIDFHRSHKRIQTSQVSEIPAELTGLWTKTRRFALTWELVKQIRPSRLLTMRTTLQHAQCAYEALDKGTEIAVAFDYESSKFK